VVPKIVQYAPNPRNMILAMEALYSQEKVGCSDLPWVGLNPNDVKFGVIGINNYH